jgi:D-xylose transport system permease protein
MNDKLQKFLSNNSTFLAFLFIVLILSILDSAFLTPRNLSNLTRQVTDIGIVSIGMTIVILIGGIDLSVGSVLAVSSMTSALLLKQGFPVWAVLLISIVVIGGIAGFWNGFWVVRFRIPAFIITLGMMTIGRGAALVISEGSSVSIDNELFVRIGGSYLPVTLSLVIIAGMFLLYMFSLYHDIREKQKYKMVIHKGQIIYTVLICTMALAFSLYTYLLYRGIPIPVLLFFCIAVIFHYVLKNTRYGRQVYAIGGNADAARHSGINISRVTIIVYMLASMLASLSGIILASRLNGSSPNLGNMYELDAISAVIIGGTSFSGGVGGVPGTVLGVFIVGVMNNGMSLIGINMFYQLVIKGVIITLAVWIDVMSKRNK